MKETLTRLLSGIVYVVLLILATSFSFNSFLVLFGFFLICCVVEFCDLVHLKKVLPLVIASLGYFLFSYFPISKTTEILLLMATLFVSVQLMYSLFNARKQKSDTTSKYVYLIGYIILPIILITKIPFTEEGYNPKIIISIFILIWTNDTFAYIVGKSIGKRKLFEQISPKKTIEGFLGGLLFALIAGIIIALYYLNQSVLNWIIIALIVGIFGTIGDLIESRFKRIAGVKDSGTIMPGHGGILDRLDSVIFAAPIIFLFHQIINYVS